MEKDNDYVKETLQAFRESIGKYGPEDVVVGDAVGSPLICGIVTSIKGIGGGKYLIDVRSGSETKTIPLAYVTHVVPGKRDDLFSDWRQSEIEEEEGRR